MSTRTKKRTSWYTGSEKLFGQRRASFMKKLSEKKLSSGKDTISSYFDSTTATTTDIWQYITVSVLPLFNGEGIQEPIEYLNELVSQQLSIRDPAGVLTDLKELLRMGMTIIQEKIPNIPDELLAVRLVELWNFLFGNIVPYLEGVFEPLSLDDDRIKIDYGDSSRSSFVRDMTLLSCREYVLKPTIDRIESILYSSFSDISNDKRAIDALWKLIQLFSIVNVKKDEFSRRIDTILRDLKSYATSTPQGMRRVDSALLV